MNILLPFAAAWSQIYTVVANIIIALLCILIGYLIAKGLGLAVTYILKAIQLDKAAKAVKFNTLLEKAEIKKGSAELLGDIVYWLILFVTIVGVANLVGLKVEPVVTKLFIYLGLALLTALVLGLGLFFASLLSGIVRVILLNLGVEGGKSLSRFIYYLVVLFTFLAALSQLGLRPSSIIGKLDIILGAPALAAAIAFGLGCKDMAADFLHNIFKGK